MKNDFKIYDTSYIISQGVEYDNLYWQVCDDRAYADEQGTLFTGISYEFYSNRQLRYYEIYQNGWGIETIEFYENGAVAEHNICSQKSTRRKVEKWHIDGNIKEISYFSSGTQIASKEWDKYGKLISKQIWNDHIILAGFNTMQLNICSGEMSENDCYKMQLYLKNYIFQEKIIDLSDIHYIAGVDLAYWKESDIEYAVCCIVVMDYRSHQIVERVHLNGVIKVPYIAGYLAFRELPLIIETVKKLTTIPDIYMFDGNGILHPRMMGIATHASFFLKKPTLGVAKSYYKINDTECEMPEIHSGEYKDIVVNGEVYGRALRTHDNVNPVFISVGNYIDLQSVTTIVLDTVGKESHIPIPTREADIYTHKMRDLYKT